MTDTTQVMMPIAANLAVMFKVENGLDPLLHKIKTDALTMVKDLDPASKKDRELMRSTASKVSADKAEIDRRGKELTEVQRREVNAVNAGRKVAERFLAALRDEVRKPADDWDAAEEAHSQRCKECIHAIVHHGMSGEDTPEAIAEAAGVVKAVQIGPEFKEYEPQAVAAREIALASLRAMYGAAKLREEQAAELAQLRAEKLAREAADAAEAARVEGLRMQAEHAARLEAEIEAQHAATEKAEAAWQAKVQAEREAANEAARLQAIAVADQALAREAEQAARHAVELAQAAERERNRLAAQAQADLDTQAARAKDKAHRAMITADIVAALGKMAGFADPQLIAEALIEGRIPHCRVML